MSKEFSQGLQKYCLSIIVALLAVSAVIAEMPTVAVFEVDSAESGFVVCRVCAPEYRFQQS
ncbi:MAG: hypothetical protein K8R90_00785 [Candidatus Cloacimonetes bacterium]|nr:hypothetical protein [Candidatus Cloacimonadota bacterium]